ncbi:hypothetical protein Pmob_1289 [Petrotoga mobilis SJ95]|uniref:Uncharacterized protein n=1 Tax=Petrotoga mobilis (strain DSM 10674 / SJ95) TaxID=403833 RepID=A9BGF1_PETMO|nr:hypothetical protein [Petrotoga mobilis]ABX32001.1 hypothetical protein Pmob_1289 [Petrotoga mobilis SJ95]
MISFSKSNLIKNKKKIDINWALLFSLVFLCVLVVSLLIYLRIEIANKAGMTPNFTVSYDMLKYRNAPFYTDELTYFNFIPYESFSEALLNRYEILFYDKQLININLYGYFIYFLTDILGIKWQILFWFTGFTYYIVFIILIYYILIKIIGCNSSKAFILTLFLGLSPPVLQLAASWLRDLLIIDLLLFSLIFSKNKNFFGWLIVTILQMFIRAYMVVPHLLMMIHFFMSNQKKKKLFSSIIFTTFTLIIILVLLYNQYGLERFISEFPQRFVQNFSGLSLWLVTGKIVPEGNIYNFLPNIEDYANYFFVAFYLLIYLIWAIKIVYKNERLSFEQKKWLFLFLVIGFYIVILHSAMLGFFVARIQLITAIFAFFFLASLIGQSDREETKAKSALS